MNSAIETAWEPLPSAEQDQSLPPGHRCTLCGEVCESGWFHSACADLENFFAEASTRDTFDGLTTHREFNAYPSQRSDAA